ncbi:YheC/YheD family protein [Evansella sp. AB-P1]|uniref:YheC/YheD family endospore coat-associated protein n=1 Tax=Evansella sp. AB-P1 TaxID=3037653 RepID=UPI00241F9D8F|nr:YheC/YheD family protein [Evansella sp. AB-P1]MDG5786385.1 YheC/YheD family protein [Evansella sp. AB-P1]
MSSLGILQLNPTIHNEYMNELAKSCSLAGIDVISFSPFNYDEKNNSVKGLLFNRDKNFWNKTTYPLPLYIYDRIFFPSNKSIHPQINRMLNQIKEKTTFLGTGLPNKWTVYKWLNDNHFIKEFLPPTELLKKSTLQTFLNQYGEIIIKPIFGSNGIGIYVIERKRGDLFSIYCGKRKQHHLIRGEIETLHQYLIENVISSNYLIQPMLSLKVGEQPFDLRTILHKTSSQKWIVVGNGFRIGNNRSFISNLHGGGIVSPSMKISKKYMESVKKTVKQLLHVIPYHLNNYHHPLFELGIDLGIDLDGNVWILEINSKPGYQTVMKTTTPEKRLEIYKGIIQIIEHTSIPKSKNNDIL